MRQITSDTGTYSGGLGQSRMLIDFNIHSYIHI